MPLAATLATTETFDAFLGKKKWHALLHGHSFTVTFIMHARISVLTFITSFHREQMTAGAADVQMPCCAHLLSID